ncbi:MAG: ABC transporter substrate-binding protein [Clostridia bacterium]
MKQWIALLMAAMLALGAGGAAAEVIPAQAEATVAPATVQAEATVAPATVQAEAAVAPATVQAEATVAPAIAQAEAAVAPAIVQTLGGRTIEQTYEELIVGTITPPDGCFFTGLFGNNTSDIDVRDLLTGYQLTEWNLAAGAYQIDPSVVTGLTATLDDAGNKTYIIALADDLVYSDGTPITAKDYAFDFILRASSQMAAIGGATGVPGILGADEYMLGGASTIAGVKLQGDYQLSVTISAAYLPFFYELSLLQANPYPISVIAPGCEVADDGAGVYVRNIDKAVLEPIYTAQLLEQTVLDPEKGYLSHPGVTSGPYTLTKYDQTTREAAFAINPHYKGDATGKKPVIARIKLTPVAREDIAGKLAAGDIDLINKAATKADIDAGMQLVGQGAARSANYLRTGLSYLSFTCEQGPTASQKVREAIARAFDRDGFVQKTAGNYGVAVNGYYGIGQWMVQLVNGTLSAPVAPVAEDATPEQVAAFEAQKAQWALLTLDGLDAHALDLAAAKALLIEDGWTLNGAGEPFDETKDAVRARTIDGQSEELSLKLLVSQGNAALIPAFEETLVRNLAQIGVKLEVEPVAFSELLHRYYRKSVRECDMFYLGTNFMTTFDPSRTYATDAKTQQLYNASGLSDPTLEALAVQMRKTPEGDVLAYCQNWLAFEEHWNEVLPAVPICSNVYFDFYSNKLQNYQPGANLGWAKAIMYAYLSDAPEAPVVVEGAPPADDGLVVIE